jgi:hypothetical protein
MISTLRPSTSSAKTKKRRDAILYSAFEAGAQARADAGLSCPPAKIPKRGPRIPAKYTGRSERKLWGWGWRMGYGHGLTKDEGKAYPRHPDRPKRALPGMTRKIMIGHWVCLSGARTIRWDLSEDGAFTGAIKEGKKIMADFDGKWELQGRYFWTDYKSNTYPGATGSRYVQSDPLIKFNRNSFVIETDDMMQLRFTRVRRKRRL